MWTNCFSDERHDIVSWEEEVVTRELQDSSRATLIALRFLLTSGARTVLRDLVSSLTYNEQRGNWIIIIIVKRKAIKVHW